MAIEMKSDDDHDADGDNHSDDTKTNQNGVMDDHSSDAAQNHNNAIG